MVLRPSAPNSLLKLNPNAPFADINTSAPFAVLRPPNAPYCAVCTAVAARMVMMVAAGLGMMTKVIWWSADNVWRGGVEREKVGCRLLARVGVAGNLAGRDGGAGKI
ncbi:hypothetical protein Tco_1158402 [Tanacetum coccineum]